MSEKEKVYYKRKTANWRKRYFYDYLGGELSREPRMVQWTHTALEDIIFDLAQQNKFLSFESAIKRYKLEQLLLCCINFHKSHACFLVTSKSRFKKLETGR